jgi:hypothetical protein
MAHIVIGEVIAAHGVPWHCPHEALHHEFGRISKQERSRAIRAIGANRSELSQLLRVWDWPAVGADRKAHSRNEDAVKEAFRIAGNPAFQTG